MASDFFPAYGALRFNRKPFGMTHDVHDPAAQIKAHDQPQRPSKDDLAGSICVYESS
jgi:hypothetical protein